MMLFTIETFGMVCTLQNKNFGYKTLFEVNGLPSIELKYHYPGLDQELLAKIKEQEIATLHLSDAIICPSNVTRDYIASLGLNRKLVTVIPNGVSSSDFSASPLPARDGRVPVLLYIGTLADWQGLDIVIRALPKILNNILFVSTLSGADVRGKEKFYRSKSENLALKNMSLFSPPFLTTKSLR
jgi:glycosyltransferase involved in cell wall biosynthesis